MKDRRMTRVLQVRGSACKPVDGVLARHNSWDEVDVSESKWNHMEARRSERSSLHASAEVLLEASTDASTGSIRGSFQSHKKMRLSTSSMEASTASMEVSIDFHEINNSAPDPAYKSTTNTARKQELRRISNK